MSRLASSTNSQVLYRNDMRARRMSKAGQKAMRLLDNIDNIIVVVVYVAVAAVVLRELYRFVQDAVSR